MRGKTISFNYEYFDSLLPLLGSINLRKGQLSFVLIGLNENDYSRTYDLSAYNLAKNQILESALKKERFATKRNDTSSLIDIGSNELVERLGEYYITVFEYVLIIVGDSHLIDVVMNTDLGISDFLDFECWEENAELLLFCDINHERCTLLEYNELLLSEIDRDVIF